MGQCERGWAWAGRILYWQQRGWEGCCHEINLTQGQWFCQKPSFGFPGRIVPWALQGLEHSQGKIWETCASRGPNSDTAISQVKTVGAVDWVPSELWSVPQWDLGVPLLMTFVQKGPGTCLRAGAEFAGRGLELRRAFWEAAVLWLEKLLVLMTDLPESWSAFDS